MHKLLACLGLVALMPTGEARAFASLPENPVAFENCTARVKVFAARLRAGPSLDAKILGRRSLDESLYVTKVYGKWVQVILANGDTAYMAAYLLTFPYKDLLEQWKKDTPSPSVGKKAKVKWAAAHYRKYPSARSPRLGRFFRGDEVAVLSESGAWALVESRAGPDGPCFGFIAKSALAPPDVPDPEEWTAPLAQVRRLPGENLEPLRESPSTYLARTAWSPQVFRLELELERGPAMAGPDALDGVLALR